MQRMVLGLDLAEVDQTTAVCAMLDAWEEAQKTNHQRLKDKILMWIAGKKFWDSKQAAGPHQPHSARTIAYEIGEKVMYPGIESDIKPILIECGFRLQRIEGRKGNWWVLPAGDIYDPALLLKESEDTLKKVIIHHLRTFCGELVSTR